MPKKEEPFYRNCSTRDCDAVRAEVWKSYDSVAEGGKKPAKRWIGGVETRLLPPTMIRPSGLTKEFPYGKGKRIHFKRCYMFDYIDRRTHKQTTETCTDEKIYKINQNTLGCYGETLRLLQAIRRGKKGRTGERDKVLALLACSSSGVATTRVSEPLSARIISAATEVPLRTTRNSISYLKRTHKITCGLPKLDVVDEDQCSVPKPYLKTFRAFVKGEREERTFAGLRRLFGESIPKAADMPEPEESPFYEKHGRLYRKK